MIVDMVVSLLLLASGGLALAGALGLWRLPDFFMRMHAPSLAITLGSWMVTLASVVAFSTGPTRLSLHVWLIIMLLAVTAPVTTVLLARAALFRQRRLGDALPPPLTGRTGEGQGARATASAVEAERTSGRQ